MLPNHRVAAVEPFLFISRLWRVRTHAPSVAAKLRLVARFTALAVLASTLSRLRGGGAYRDRTDDLMLAKQPLSQLS